MTTRSRHRNPESGYAVLLVFAMASIVALTLYQQLPRAAFEAQREKEALLINHGEQYKRGVQLYVRKLGRYPPGLEALDNTQGIRFLRRHFFDPMTGKEEWRLLHMGPNGKLIDSKIEAVDPNKDKWHEGSITEFKAPASSSDSGGPENANIATRRRPSDEQLQPGLQGGMMPGSGPSDPSLAASSGTPESLAAMAANGGAPAAPIDPNAPPKPAAPPAWLNGGALPGMPIGQRGVVAPLNATTQNGATALANAAAAQSSIGGNGGYSSSVSGNGGFGSPSSTPTQSALSPQNIPPQTAPGYGNPGFGGAPVNSQYQGQSPQPMPGNAANMIQNLLTQPRPGGAPSGLPGALNGVGGAVVGGFAGVATTVKGHGIHRYNDQDEYIKWEFYYDMGAEQAAAVQNQMRNAQAPPGPATGFTPGGFGSSAGTTPAPR